MGRAKNIKTPKGYKINPVLIQLGILSVLALITYANTFTHGLNLDDFLIQDNIPTLEEGWKGVFSVFGDSFNRFDYRPVSVLTFAVEQMLQGELVPKTSHIINVLLYLICCIVLFFFIKELPVERSGLLAFVTTALFIVHPIHSNVISSLKNRDSILSLTIGLLSLILILKFIKFRHSKTGVQVLGKSGYLLGAVAVFFLATITKLDSLTFIVIIPVLLMLFWKHWWTLLFGSGLGYLLFRAFEYVRYRVITPRFLETTNAEESTLITENPMVANDAVTMKISTALASIFYYLKFHLIPKGYYYYFGFDMIPVEKMWTWQNIVVIFVLLVSAIAFFFYLRKRPEISLAIGFFYGGLSYCVNIVTPIAGIVAPRLAFIASVGFCLLLAILLIDAGGLIKNKKKDLKWSAPKITYGLLLLAILIYIPFTIHRNAAWKDIFTLIERDTPHLGRSFEGQRIACMNYLNRAENEQDPGKFAEYWNTCLGYCEGASSVFDEDQFVEEAIGIANTQLGDKRSAFIQFKKVVEKFDTTEVGNEMIGDLYMSANKPDSALAYYETLINIAPEAHIGYIKYTRAIDASGRFEEGIEKCVDFANRYRDYPYVLESIGYLELKNKDTLKAADFLFAAITFGAPPDEYLSVLVPYLQKNGREDLWLQFQNGQVKNREELMSIYGIH